MSFEVCRFQGWGAIGQIYADYCILKTMDDEDDTEENVSCFYRLLDPSFKKE